MQLVNISEQFVEECKTFPQWSLDNELFYNVGYNSLQLVKFFLEDPRLPNHADINFGEGRCLYSCKSREMLRYFILDMGLKMTPQMYDDILNNQVNFPEETLFLFKKTQLYFKLQNKLSSKNKEKRKKI